LQVFDRALGNGRSIRVCTTDRSDGDFSVHGPVAELDKRRRLIIDRPWVWLEQVHGATCVDVDALGLDTVVGQSADASLSQSMAVALCIQTADCIPLMLWSEDACIAAVHVGWKGLEAGVIDSALDALRFRSGGTVSAFIGPSIGSECYEFGETDLNRFRRQFGDGVSSVTSQGTPSLDVRNAVRSELDRHGVALVGSDERCTACDQRFFSHRARGDTGRQTTVIWIEEE